MKDFSIYESADGGDLLIINEDISLADSLLQIVYLSLFGGNIQSNTLGNEKNGDFRTDWWANGLLFKDEPEKQMNSLTEKTLNSVALNSAGRIQILNSVNEDLKYLKPIVNIQADVSIKSTNRVEINVKLNKYQNKEEVQLQFLWDNIQNSIIIQKLI